MKKEINLIIAPQEYKLANHKELWDEISQKSDSITVVLNIGADIFVSLYKRKIYRIIEAFNQPLKVRENLLVLRPLFLLRPEISNILVNKVNGAIFKKQLKKIITNLNDYQINVIHYGGIWPVFLNNLNLNFKYYYYVLDEVRNDAHNNEINLKRLHQDKISCETSESIFLMSSKLIENRIEYSNKMKIIGNGSSIKLFKSDIKLINQSVGIIGNIRNWIDCDLLENLILSRQDLHFGFVGNIEKNMLSYVNYLLEKYNNVKYYGKVEKEDVHNYYKMFNVVIVPYKQNEFMKATRPIKIVESIFALTPVVTIPISGYDTNSFIKFATNASEFSLQIDELIKSGIDKESIEYQSFIEENSWSFKAKEILNEFK